MTPPPTPQRQAAAALLDGELDVDELADYLEFLQAVDEGLVDWFYTEERVPFVVALDAEA